MIKRLNVKGSEKIGSEVKIFGGMCVLSCTYSYVTSMMVTVQYDFSHCYLLYVSCSLLCSN